MKTRILLTFILLTTLIQNSFPQTYIPLLNNSSWNIELTNLIGYEYVWIEPGVDVLIGSFTYKKFIDVVDFNQTEIYIREDVATKKVYRRLNNSDVLMFDFSLQVGNTITLGNGDLYSVSNISNINVNGGQRRIFTLYNQTTSYFIPEIWIEGVGNSGHPLRPSFELPTDPSYSLICSYQNGVSVYNYGLANGNNATICPNAALSIENQNLLAQKINIFPNPFSTKTTIKIEPILENACLELRNSIGQKVKEIKNISTNEIFLSRETLVNGIYFLTIKQNEKIIETKKIIIKD